MCWVLRALQHSALEVPGDRTRETAPGPAGGVPGRQGGALAPAAPWDPQMAPPGLEAAAHHISPQATGSGRWGMRGHMQGSGRGPGVPYGVAGGSGGFPPSYSSTQCAEHGCTW